MINLKLCIEFIKPIVEFVDKTEIRRGLLMLNVLGSVNCSVLITF